MNGERVARVVIEIRSLVGNVSRPLLLTFLDSFDDFLAKAALRHTNPVTAFIYEATPSEGAASQQQPSSTSNADSKPRRVTVHSEEEFDVFKQWALQQRERTIDIWLVTGVF